MKRFLVTTALEETWRDDEPTIFLGEWCRRYSRRNYWSKMDAEVLPYHWDDRAKLHADYKYLVELYERLLRELSAQLNQIHGVKHSLRYWRILIGPWLGQFTQILFDRWTNLQRAISQYDLSNTIVLTGQEDTLVPKYQLEFERFYFDDEWNHYIYGLLLQKYTNVPCTRVMQRGERSEPKQVPASFWNGSFKGQLLFCYSRIASVLTRDQDAFFLSTYLHPLDELKLCQRLGQVPHIWCLPRPVYADVKMSRRQWTVTGESRSTFEDCARTLISQQIPTVYLEGYEQLVEQVADVPWPKQPKLIWTSNSHIPHDVFKAWAAEKTECGTPLVIGQHGGHYGIGRWLFTEDHEIAISDYYLSWGWSDPDCPKIKPVGKFSVKKPLKVCHAEQTGLLMVSAAVPRQSYYMYSTMVSRQQIDYFDDQHCFVENLPDHIRGELTVRLYSKDYGWDQLARWQDKFSDIALDTGKSNIRDLISKSRLYIATYNSTTYLEMFAMNVPTVIFWNPNHWELRDSAIPYFEDLKRVGIFHETPNSAARHVAAIWDDVDAWWISSAVRDVVENFKMRYCYTDDGIFDRIESVFRDAVNTSKLSVAPSSLIDECKPENKE